MKCNLLLYFPREEKPKQINNNDKTSGLHCVQSFGKRRVQEQNILLRLELACVADVT